MDNTSPQPSGDCRAPQNPGEMTPHQLLTAYIAADEECSRTKNPKDKARREDIYKEIDLQYRRRLVARLHAEMGPILRRHGNTSDLVQSVLRRWSRSPGDPERLDPEVDCLWQVFQQRLSDTVAEKLRYADQKKRDWRREEAGTIPVLPAPTDDDGSQFWSAVWEVRDNLKPKEQELLDLLALGWWVKKIARHYKVSEATVRRRIKKLEARAAEILGVETPAARGG